MRLAFLNRREGRTVLLGVWTPASPRRPQGSPGWFGPRHVLRALR